MMISRKIFTDSLKLDNEYLLNQIHAAIKSLQNKEQIKLIVSPEEAERLYNISEQLTQKIKELDNINIISDSNIATDCLIVESLKSRVYSNLSEELNEVENQLQKEYKANEQTLEATIKQVDYKVEEAIDEIAANTEIIEEENIETKTEEIVTSDEQIIENNTESNAETSEAEQPAEDSISEISQEMPQQTVDNENDDEFQPLVLNEVKVQEKEITKKVQVEDESSSL